jgi:DNA-3-methyladenine glycosylase I
VTRCAWVPEGDELYAAYHDEEWGVPSHDERHLFEMLVLEGAQAGLSWSTILRKREGYREAFAGWDVVRIARFGDRDVERLMGDAGIVRNRLKIESAIANAQAMLALEEGLDELLWSFVGGEPKQNRFKKLGDIPAETARPSATRSCRAAGWSTTTPPTASATARLSPSFRRGRGRSLPLVGSRPRRASSRAGPLAPPTRLGRRPA